MPGTGGGRWTCWEWTVSSHPSLQLTVLNAGRRYLGAEDLAGKVFVTSGLGGMSGAQAKASVIVGCIGVIAEVSPPGTPSPHPCLPRSFLIPEPLTLTPISSLAPATKPAARWLPRAADTSCLQRAHHFRGQCLLVLSHETDFWGYHSSHPTEGLDCSGEIINVCE